MTVFAIASAIVIPIVLVTPLVYWTRQRRQVIREAESALHPPE